MNKSVLYSTVAALMIFPAMSMAEEESDQEKIKTLDEVVVTATKTEETRKDVPNSVILYDEYDLEDLPSTSIGELLAIGDGQARAEALDLMKMAAERLDPLIGRLRETPLALTDELAEQRAGWDLFYDVLSALEKALGEGDPKAFALRDAARRVVQACRIEPGGA